jgi:hypothetical protein
MIMLIVIYSAHARLCDLGVLHRDISINNIMLSSPKNIVQGLLIDYDYAFCSSLLFPLDPESAQPPCPGQPSNQSDPPSSKPLVRTSETRSSAGAKDREMLLDCTVCILIHIIYSHPKY